MATFTLEDLRNEVSKRYAPTVIQNGGDEYVLQNMLQLPAEKRDEVMDLVERFENGGEDMPLEDQVSIFKEIIIAAEDNDRGNELLALLGDNTALIFEVINRWMEATQLGEAERS